MLGLLALSSPINANIGVTRQLTYDINILNTRGLIKVGNKKNIKDLNAANMLSPTELLLPFSSTHDDPPRIGMMSTQSKHVTPIEHTNKLLIGTGVEKTLPYILSDDFIFKAKDDGVIKEINEESQLMFIEYKDKTRDMVDLSPQLVKNGGKLPPLPPLSEMIRK